MLPSTNSSVPRIAKIASLTPVSGGHEFSSKAGSRAELSTRLAKLRESIPAVIEGLNTDELEKEYPQIVLDRPMSTGEFLIHLYGHLNWHLGQVDYLRRLLTPQA